MPPFLRPFAVVSIWIGLAASLLGWSIPSPPAHAQEARLDAQSPVESRALPSDSRTAHVLNLPGRVLQFTATAGSIPIRNSEGRLLAEVGYIAYTRDKTDPRTRPVAFAFNGGPGSASTWLHLGALGPWRLPLTAAMTMAQGTPTLLANDDTWLDFADLVFIDPPGTGFSRIAPNAVATSEPAPDDAAGRGGVRRRPVRSQGARDDGGDRWFWSVIGDVATFAEVINTWTRQNDRQASPIVLVGESYGGFRAPRIAHALARDHARAVAAMVLVSPVLDFDSRRGGHLPAYYVNLLPSIAAGRMERSGGVPSRTALTAVEDYARGDFYRDLLRGPRDAAAVDRIATQVADITAVPVEAVRRRAGRLSGSTYLQEIAGPARWQTSLYDVGMTGFAPVQPAAGSRFADPFTHGLSKPMTLAMLALYDKLEWRAGTSYEMLSSETNRNWIWGNSPNSPESMSALRELLGQNVKLRVLVTHGFTDLVTPYFASQLQLDQLPIFSDPSRVALQVYTGGHMHYSRDASRAAFRSDAAALIAAAIAGAAPAVKPMLAPVQ